MTLDKIRDWVEKSNSPPSSVFIKKSSRVKIYGWTTVACKQLPAKCTIVFQQIEHHLPQWKSENSIVRALWSRKFINVIGHLIPFSKHSTRILCSVHPSHLTTERNCRGEMFNPAKQQQSEIVRKPLGGDGL